MLTASAPALFVAGALAVVAAGYVQGLTGLGFAVVCTPVLVLLTSRPREAVFLSLLLGAVLSVGVTVESRRAVRLRRSWPLLAGALVGTPVGLAVLVRANTEALQLIIAVTALVMAAVWLVRLPAPIGREPSGLAAAGLVGGFLNGSTSMGGLPPTMLVSIQRWPVLEGRAALVTFNLVSYSLAIAVGLASGIAEVGFLLRGLWLLPLAVAGALLGACSSRRIRPGAFRVTLVCVVGGSGLAVLVSAVWGGG